MRVASPASLGIDHHVFNFGDRFTADVVEPYVAAHAAGDTPNPCIECNRHLKFDKLLRRARRARLRRRSRPVTTLVWSSATTAHAGSPGAPTRARTRATCSTCSARRSSAATLLPVGELTKADGARDRRRPRPADRGEARQPGRVLHHVVTRARRVPRATASRSRRRRSSTAPAGEVGPVDAVELVTVGQRKGLGLRGGDGAPRYVVDVDVAGGHRDRRRRSATCSSRTTTLRDMTWAGDDGRTAPCSRSAARTVRRSPATFDPSTATLTWDEPQRRVAPGQAVVLYDGDEVLGGGLAVSAIPRSRASLSSAPGRAGVNSTRSVSMLRL